MGKIFAPSLLAMVLVLQGAAEPANARPESQSIRFAIEPQDLAQALTIAAQIGGASILFERSRLTGRSSKRLSATTTLPNAFAELLRGSGFAAKQIGERTFVLVAERTTPVETAASDPPVPEIVVRGRRSEDADIARHANDIQPYRVVTARDVENDQATSTEDLMRDLLPGNDLAATARQAPLAQQANVQSQIDLRGLGTAQTLVLVDGRRMPSALANDEFAQPDLNGIPPEAIARIETLGGTAGGIYGPGATGGVVNVVLKRQFNAPWITVSTGIDDHGDGAERRIAGGFSKELWGGKTHISVVASLSKDDGLTLGDRSFVAQARGYEVERSGGIPSYSVNLNVASFDGDPLTLTTRLGGQPLGANIASFPVGSLGASGNDTAAVLADAGRYDLRLSPDGRGAEQSLLTPFTTSAVIASIRQEIGAHVELFGDYLRTQDSGSIVGPGTARSLFVLDAGQAGNPFAQSIIVTFPSPGLASTESYRTTTERATLGVIARLPHSWAAELDGSIGQSAARQVEPRVPAVAVVDVFSTGALAAELASLAPTSRLRLDNTNRFVDAAFRLAGPVMSLPGGPLSLTLSGEYRREHALAAKVDPPDQVEFLAYVTADQNIAVASGAAEARLPLVPDDARFALLRGLELQLAVRADRYRISVPEQLTLFGSESPAVVVHYPTVAFTVGAKFHPVPGITVRGSFATGFLPPSPGLIVPIKSLFPFQPFADPKRPGAPIDFDSPVELISSGSPNIRQELARTLSVGFVFEPRFVPNVRASIDFTHIAKSHEITDFAAGDYNYFIAHEAQYPGRIGRAPLTAQDAALGYTAGVIDYIDASPLNVGRSLENAVDADLQYTVRLPGGILRLHTSATWTPSLRRRGDPDSAYDQLAGYSDGPIRWKGNAGAELAAGRLGASLDAQFYGAYNVAFGTSSLLNNLNNELRIEEQGTATIRAQVYVDAALSYNLAWTGGKPIRCQLGIKNLLGQLPPLFIPDLQTGTFDATYSVGYSSYGDPRGRRFQFSTTVDF